LNPRPNWQSSTRSGAWVAQRSCRNTRSRGTIAREWKSTPHGQAHRGEKTSLAADLKDCIACLIVSRKSSGILWQDLLHGITRGDFGL